MMKKSTDRIFILIILLLFAILAMILTIKTGIPSVYLDETMSIVGKFIETLVSFFKK
ncbi:MAG: hypothetical protein QMD36_01710 [Candidatus Aenigmarchaeota archaeon]|nr:hypothetical protein [Candidatus Aenigmarchaeota archaeon]